MKIGVTNTPERRVKELRWVTPFSFNAELVFEVNGSEAEGVEKYLHKNFSRIGLSGFSGAGEWFKFDGRVFDLTKQL